MLVLKCLCEWSSLSGGPRHAVLHFTSWTTHRRKTWTEICPGWSTGSAGHKNNGAPHFWSLQVRLPPLTHDALCCTGAVLLFFQLIEPSKKSSEQNWSFIIKSVTASFRFVKPWASIQTRTRTSSVSYWACWTVTHVTQTAASFIVYCSQINGVMTNHHQSNQSTNRLMSNHFKPSGVLHSGYFRV